MVNVARVEATISAKSKLRPGLNQASGELNAFRRAQQRAFSVFGSAAARASSAAVQKHAAAVSAAQARIAFASRNSVGAIAAPAALAASYKQYADVDRQISRIGITANASASELAGVRKQIEGIAYETAQSSGKVTGGLDVLVAQGRSLKEGLEFLPSVARTAAAAGAEIDDIAKSADAVSSNFKIAGRDMQAAFDIMAEGGKAGQFELKDQSRYLPSLAPAAAAAGFTGTKGLTDLVALLQIMRKGSGSSEEASSSMSNIFQKMESEETVKRFDKFGIKLRGGLEKARKEGKNLVEVFADLTEQALKGDFSKLPQLFSDMEMARGMRALLTYRKELQAMVGQIEKTASGSVGRDLTKVTNDARAQLDRMFAAVENRAVQAGGFIAKNIVLPIDEALKRIDRGENATVNKAVEGLHYSSANLIANQEIDGAAPGKYDPETRRLVDARKEFLTRQRYDEERERIGGEIGGLEAKRSKIVADDEASRKGKVLPPAIAATLDARRKVQTDPIDGQIATLRDKLASLEALFQSISEINTDLGAVEALREKAGKPRLSRKPEQPEFARVGSGTTAFTPRLAAGGSAPSIEYGDVPISTTQPPERERVADRPTSSSGEVKTALETGEFGFTTMAETGPRRDRLAPTTAADAASEAVKPSPQPPRFKVDNALPENPQGNAASNSLFNGQALANQQTDARLTKAPTGDRSVSPAFLPADAFRFERPAAEQPMRHETPPRREAAAPAFAPAGAGGFKLDDIGEVQSKVDAAKASVDSLGSSGASAGSALASGITSGLSAMEAQVAQSVARMQAQLNSLKAPSLSMGGLGGFNTGKGMAEVR
jgi:TP901 family phage tail tape measure protein